MSSSDRANGWGDVKMWNPIVSGEGRKLGSSEARTDGGGTSSRRIAKCPVRCGADADWPIRPPSFHGRSGLIAVRCNAGASFHASHPASTSTFPASNLRCIFVGGAQGWRPRLAHEPEQILPSHAQSSPIPGARYQRHDAMPRRHPATPCRACPPPPTNMPAPEPTPSSPIAATHRSRARPP